MKSHVTVDVVTRVFEYCLGLACSYMNLVSVKRMTYALLRYLFDLYIGSPHQCILALFRIRNREINLFLMKSHLDKLYSEFPFKKLYIFFYPCRNSHINKASIRLFLFFPLFLFCSHMVSIKLSSS